MIGVQLTVLGSGSGGNATLLVDGNTRVLIDVGLSYQDVSRRLAQLGIDSTAIDALVITHAHGDHTKGVRLFSRRPCRSGLRNQYNPGRMGYGRRR